jgi:hypothetical protein
MQLLKRVEEYRVSTEQEAVELIDSFKEQQCGGGYEVTKSGYALKTKKAKGEIIDSWYVVSITMNFNLE